MEMTFADQDLEDLRDNPDAKTRLGQNVVKAYRKILNIVARAKDKRDLVAMNSLRFKKLQGSQQYSMRLNDQWRLIVETDDDIKGTSLVVCAIVDYH